MNYEVKHLPNFNSARPFAVVCTSRNFNPIIARYADESKAKRRARDMNRTA